MALLTTALPSVAQWYEGFEDSASKDYYQYNPDYRYYCWGLLNADIAETGDPYNKQELKVSSAHVHVETPFLTMQGQARQWVQFSLRAERNLKEKGENNTIRLKADLQGPQGKVVASYVVTIRGNHSGAVAIHAPARFEGDVSLKITADILNGSNEGQTVYLDNFYGFNADISTNPCSGNLPETEKNPLPVTLLDFAANSTGLQWRTATEVNSDYFAVEASTDGSAFKEVGRLNAAGTSNTILHYTYPVMPFTTTYYRLKIVDRDNSYEYSKVAVVLKESLGAEKWFGVFKIGAEETPAYLVIYDITGKKVAEYHAPTSYPEIKSNAPLVAKLLTDRKQYSEKIITQ